MSDITTAAFRRLAARPAEPVNDVASEETLLPARHVFATTVAMILATAVALLFAH